MKTVLDILSASGRLVFYTKGLCKCVKEVLVIYISLTNATDGSPGSLNLKEDIIEEL